MAEGEESGIVVTFPGVDAVVGTFRQRLDPSGMSGLGSHVTVLYPFVPPSRLTPDVLQAVERIARDTRRFDVTFARTEWFGDRVLWLAPEPAAPLQDLTARFVAEFPGYPPYGDPAGEPIPHLSIAVDAPVPEMLDADRALAGLLPVMTQAAHVTLVARRSEPVRWTVLARYPLAPDPDRPESADGSRRARVS